MSTRISASTMGYTRTTDLPSAVTFTAMGWFRLASDRNAQGRYFEWTGPTNVAYMRVTSTGTTLSVGSNSGASSGAALTVGQWYHLATTFVENTTTTGHKAYLDGVQNINRDSPATLGALSTLSLGNAATFWVDTDMQAIKIWNAVLTVDEIKNEMRSVMPVRYADLYGWWPMLDTASDEVEFSGRGRNWTVAGTPTNGNHAPVSWWNRNPRRILTPPPPAGGLSIPVAMHNYRRRR